MITLRKAGERRHTTNGGQETWRTRFGGQDSDATPDAFRTLESLIEESLAPGAGFELHAQDDVEILTYLRQGALIQEAPGPESRVLAAGEFSRASAKSGTIHRSVNGSLSDGARVIQCCFTPDRNALRTPGDQKRFPTAERKGILRLILSPDGRSESLRLRQDVRIYSSLLDPGHHVVHELSPGRAAWVQVLGGRIRLGDLVLEAGDGASFVDEAAVSLLAQEASELLLFDVK